MLTTKRLAGVALRGEPETYILTKRDAIQGIHPGFENQRNCHPNLKICINSPTTRMMASHSFKMKEKIVDRIKVGPMGPCFGNS